MVPAQRRIRNEYLINKEKECCEEVLQCGDFCDKQDPPLERSRLSYIEQQSECCGSPKCPDQYCERHGLPKKRASSRRADFVTSYVSNMETECCGGPQLCGTICSDNRREKEGNTYIDEKTKVEECCGKEIKQLCGKYCESNHLMPRKDTFDKTKDECCTSERMRYPCSDKHCDGSLTKLTPGASYYHGDDIAAKKAKCCEDIKNRCEPTFCKEYGRLSAQGEPVYKRSADLRQKLEACCNLEILSDCSAIDCEFRQRKQGKYKQGIENPLEVCCGVEIRLPCGDFCGNSGRTKKSDAATYVRRQEECCGPTIKCLGPEKGKGLFKGSVGLYQGSIDSLNKNVCGRYGMVAIDSPRTTGIDLLKRDFGCCKPKLRERCGKKLKSEPKLCEYLQKRVDETATESFFDEYTPGGGCCIDWPLACSSYYEMCEKKDMLPTGLIYYDQKLPSSTLGGCCVAKEPCTQQYCQSKGKDLEKIPGVKFVDRNGERSCCTDTKKLVVCPSNFCFEQGFRDKDRAGPLYIKGAIHDLRSICCGERLPSCSVMCKQHRRPLRSDVKYGYGMTLEDCCDPNTCGTLHEMWNICHGKFLIPAKKFKLIDDNYLNNAANYCCGFQCEKELCGPKRKLLVKEWTWVHTELECCVGQQCSAYGQQGCNNDHMDYDSTKAETYGYGKECCKRRLCRDYKCETSENMYKTFIKDRMGKEQPEDDAEGFCCRDVTCNEDWGPGQKHYCGWEQHGPYQESQMKRWYYGNRLPGHLLLRIGKTGMFQPLQAVFPNRNTAFQSEWYFKTPKQYGPYSGSQMQSWYNKFPADQRVRHGKRGKFQPVRVINTKAALQISDWYYVVYDLRGPFSGSQVQNSYAKFAADLLVRHGKTGKFQPLNVMFPTRKTAFNAWYYKYPPSSSDLRSSEMVLKRQFSGIVKYEGLYSACCTFTCENTYRPVDRCAADNKVKVYKDPKTEVSDVENCCRERQCKFECEEQLIDGYQGVQARPNAMTGERLEDCCELSCINAPCAKVEGWEIREATVTFPIPKDRKVKLTACCRQKKRCDRYDYCAASADLKSNDAIYGDSLKECCTYKTCHDIETGKGGYAGCSGDYALVPNAVFQSDAVVRRDAQSCCVFNCRKHARQWCSAKDSWHTASKPLVPPPEVALSKDQCCESTGKYCDTFSRCNLYTNKIAVAAAKAKTVLIPRSSQSNPMDAVDVCCEDALCRKVFPSCEAHGMIKSAGYKNAPATFVGREKNQCCQEKPPPTCAAFKCTQNGVGWVQNPKEAVLHGHQGNNPKRDCCTFDCGKAMPVGRWVTKETPKLPFEPDDCPEKCCEKYEDCKPLCMAMRRPTFPDVTYGKDTTECCNIATCDFYEQTEHFCKNVGMVLKEGMNMLEMDAQGRAVPPKVETCCGFLCKNVVCGDKAVMSKPETSIVDIKGNCCTDKVFCDSYGDEECARFGKDPVKNAGTVVGNTEEKCCVARPTCGDYACNAKLFYKADASQAKEPQPLTGVDEFCCKSMDCKDLVNQDKDYCASGGKEFCTEHTVLGGTQRTNYCPQGDAAKRPEECCRFECGKSMCKAPLVWSGLEQVESTDECCRPKLCEEVNCEDDPTFVAKFKEMGVSLGSKLSGRPKSGPANTATCCQLTCANAIIFCANADGDYNARKSSGAPLPLSQNADIIGQCCEKMSSCVELRHDSPELCKEKSLDGGALVWRDDQQFYDRSKGTFAGSECCQPMTCRDFEGCKGDLARNTEQLGKTVGAASTRQDQCCGYDCSLAATKCPALGKFKASQPTPPAGVPLAKGKTYKESCCIGLGETCDVWATTGCLSYNMMPKKDVKMKTTEVPGSLPEGTCCRDGLCKEMPESCEKQGMVKNDAFAANAEEPGFTAGACCQERRLALCTEFKCSADSRANGDKNWVNNLGPPLSIKQGLDPFDVCCIYRCPPVAEMAQRQAQLVGQSGSTHLLRSRVRNSLDLKQHHKGITETKVSKVNMWNDIRPLTCDLEAHYYFDGYEVANPQDCCREIPIAKVCKKCWENQNTKPFFTAVCSELNPDPRANVQCVKKAKDYLNLGCRNCCGQLQTIRQGSFKKVANVLQINVNGNGPDQGTGMTLTCGDLADANMYIKMCSPEKTTTNGDDVKGVFDKDLCDERPKKLRQECKRSFPSDECLV